MKRWGWAMAIVGWVGCAQPSAEPPAGVLQDSDFVQVMTEIQLLEATAKKHLRREDDEQAVYRGQYLAIFEAHGITEATFRASHAWWFDHPELLLPIYDGVVEQLNAWERDWGQIEAQSPPPVRSRTNE